jgi:putative transposase
VQEGIGVKFNSALAPPYVRRSARVAAALPWLYLKGISSGDLGEALEVLVGEDAKGLSAAALGRLKAAWAEEYKDWTQRSLEGRQYAYWWVDGIYTTLRESDDPKLCLLVIIGVRPDGTKEWVAIGDGLRESTESWLDVLRDLKARGLQAGPRLAVGDGALGFWGALDQVYPETVHQRCWFHKMGNVLNALPKSLQGKAKADLQAIWMAPTRKQATQAFKRFITAMGPNTPRRPRSSRRTARPCSPSSPSRPSTGCTCAPPTRSSRPSPPCAIAPAGPRTASPAQPSSVWPSR